jgi:hypothetical protein
VTRAQALDATRLAALTQLTRLWNKPVRDVMKIIGWESGEDEKASHPTRRPKAGAQSRR